MCTASKQDLFGHNNRTLFDGALGKRIHISLMTSVAAAAVEVESVYH